MSILEEITRYRELLEYSGRVYWEGILCTVDEPSTKSPSGANKRKVILKKEAVQKSLSSLIGAPLNYRQDWSGHQHAVTSAEFKQVSKNPAIGLITQANVDGNLVKVRGYLVTEGHNDLLKNLKEASAKGELGMSYEALGARVENINDPNFYVVNQINFTGASILYRDKAAYRSSSFRILPNQMIKDVPIES